MRVRRGAERESGAWSAGGEREERGPKKGIGAEGFIMKIAQTKEELKFLRLLCMVTEFCMRPILMKKSK